MHSTVQGAQHACCVAWHASGLAVDTTYHCVQVPQMGGLTYAAKDRWCVIMPRYTLPKPGHNVSTVRVMLWVYKDATSAEPRTKVWLDGAAAFRIGEGGLEGTVVSVCWGGGWGCVLCYSGVITYYQLASCKNRLVHFCQCKCAGLCMLSPDTMYGVLR